jgi:hypothetical protein
MSTSNADTRPCPYCAEEIKVAAIFCKHCRRDIPKNSDVKTAPIPDKLAAPSQQTSPPPREEGPLDLGSDEDDDYRHELTEEIFKRWDSVGRPEYIISSQGLMTFPGQPTFSDEVCQLLLGRDSYATWVSRGRKPIELNLKHFREAQIRAEALRHDSVSHTESRPPKARGGLLVTTIAVLLVVIAIVSIAVNLPGIVRALDRNQKSATAKSQEGSSLTSSLSTDIVERLKATSDLGWYYDPFQMPGFDIESGVLGGTSPDLCQILTFRNEGWANTAANRGLFKNEARNYWIGTDEMTGLGEIVVAKSGAQACAVAAATTFGWGTLQD